MFFLAHPGLVWEKVCEAGFLRSWEDDCERPGTDAGPGGTLAGYFLWRWTLRPARSGCVGSERRQEHAELPAQGDITLTNTKYRWLTTPPPEFEFREPHQLQSPGAAHAEDIAGLGDQGTLRRILGTERRVTGRGVFCEVPPPHPALPTGADEATLAPFQSQPTAMLGFKFQAERLGAGAGRMG